jgi:hypothetical protein
MRAGGAQPPARAQSMRLPLASAPPSALASGRVCLVLAGACAALVVAAALLVLAVVVSASAVVTELGTAAGTLIGISSARRLKTALGILPGSKRQPDSNELEELRRQLAVLPETPHPLGF